MARKDEERAERLAAALRENLKRRKAQAREAAEGAKAGPGASADDRQGEELIVPRRRPGSSGTEGKTGPRPSPGNNQD